MRRTLAILVLSFATALTAASCGSSPETSTSASSSTVAPGAGKVTSTTTKKPTGAPVGKEMGAGQCTALEGFLKAYGYAGLDESKQADKQETVVKGLTTNAGALKKAMPNTSADIDTLTTYITKVVKGETTTPAEKEAADTAKNKLNFFKSNCPGDGKKPGGPTTPGKGPTTTKK